MTRTYIERKPVKDQVLKDWLLEFTAVNTRRGYTSAMRKYKQVLGIMDLGTYLKTETNYENDLKKFLAQVNDKPSTSIRFYSAVIRTFFKDHEIELDKNEIRKMQRRNFIPKRKSAATRDKKPTRQQLRKILDYTDVKGRALILFLASTGCRIGETLQLRKTDLDLNSNPPKCYIRAEITKGKVGQRTVYMSFEARDAIQNWLEIKDSLGKTGGFGTYGGLLIFPFSSNTARAIWNNAARKAGLDQKDSTTNRHIYHIHSLRKFFRSESKIDLDIIHSLMGHSEYLDQSYRRYTEDELEKAYLEAMPNLSIYGIDDSIRANLETKTSEIELLKAQVAKLTKMFEDSIEVFQGNPTHEQALRIEEESYRLAEKKQGKKIKHLTEGEYILDEKTGQWVKVKDSV